VPLHGHARRAARVYICRQGPGLVRRRQRQSSPLQSCVTWSATPHQHGRFELARRRSRARGGGGRPPSAVRPRPRRRPQVRLLATSVFFSFSSSLGWPGPPACAPRSQLCCARAAGRRRVRWAGLVWSFMERARSPAVLRLGPSYHWLPSQPLAPARGAARGHAKGTPAAAGAPVIRFRRRARRPAGRVSRFAFCPLRLSRVASSPLFYPIRSLQIVCQVGRALKPP